VDLRDPNTGEGYVRKLRRRWDDPQHARELTFSCFHRYQFLRSDRARSWLIDAVAAAREKCGYHLWAFVIMPEHVHLLIHPASSEVPMADFLRAVKEPVGRKAIAYLRKTSSEWLERVSVPEGRRVRHRFWQPGGGYDRNVTATETLRFMIDYIHNNPVRRGLVARPEDYLWSSARWFAGERPVALEMDRSVFNALN
jgi:putative transposase